MYKIRTKVMLNIKRLLIVATSVLLAIYTSGLFSEGRAFLQLARAAAEYPFWDKLMEHYGIPFGQFCITTIYRIYIKLTVVNVLVFSTKYFPTGIYLYTFVNSVYRCSSERMKIKQIELEDIVLQIAIVNTKQCVRETKCAEYTAELRRESARLQAVRTHVHDVIAADDSLRAVVERFLTSRRQECQDTAEEPDLKSISIMTLLKDLTENKNGQNGMLEGITEYGGQRPFDSVSENSEYSSLSEAEDKTDCRIKIIKVTNVYKVAYLKNYIKQKRLRRASKHALLKKKMEGIKRLLEDWQMSLNLVINDNLWMLDRRDEAMGDGSKQRDSDSDSELRASADTCAEDYSVWDHPQCYGCCEEPETSESREDFESEEYCEKYYGYYNEDSIQYQELLAAPRHEGLEKQSPCDTAIPLPPILEKTSSQMLQTQELDKVDNNDSREHIVTA